jgi:transposase, IS30 family
MARTRRVYSAGERRELWRRWRRGESISGIGRALDRAPGTIFTTLRERGGIAPPERRRSRLALTVLERRRSHAALRQGSPAGRSRAGWTGVLRRSAAR